MAGPDCATRMGEGNSWDSPALKPPALAHPLGSPSHLSSPGVQSPTGEPLPPIFQTAAGATLAKDYGHKRALTLHGSRAPRAMLPPGLRWGEEQEFAIVPPFLAPSPFPLGSLPNPLMLRVTSLGPGTRCFIFNSPPLPLGELHETWGGETPGLGTSSLSTLFPPSPLRFVASGGVWLLPAHPPFPGLPRFCFFLRVLVWWPFLSLLPINFHSPFSSPSLSSLLPLPSPLSSAFPLLCPLPLLLPLGLSGCQHGGPWLLGLCRPTPALGPRPCCSLSLCGLRQGGRDHQAPLESETGGGSGSETLFSSLSKCNFSQKWRKI